jgi:hypothetical protein
MHDRFALPPSHQHGKIDCNLLSLLITISYSHILFEILVQQMPARLAVVYD